MLQHFTDDNFQKDVIEASQTKPVLVDFFAAWCGPCRMQGPIVEELANELGGKAVVGKLDTEEANKTAAHYGVMSIPTLMVFKGGVPVETMIGLQPKENLKAVLEKHS
jgi:thioredoxin 1